MMSMADGRQAGGPPPRRGPVRAGHQPADIFLFGREAEVEALLAVLARLASGSGRSIALVGEPGIGKSTLMRTLVARARTNGIPVFTAHGRGADMPSPADVSFVAGGPAVSAESTGPAQGSGVLVVVDDLHLLAADQIPGVERFLDAAAAGPVLCLLAYRQRQLSAELAVMLSRASSAGLLEVWHLGALSLDQARNLLGGIPNAEEVCREAGGNPQYLKVLAAEGGTSADADLAILGELADLGPAALAVVQAAAVLGEPFHPDLLAGVAGLEIPEAMAALDTLTRLDLVRPAQSVPHLALRHGAVGTVVYRRLDPSRRVALHQRAESALAERAAPITLRAHHIARSADPRRPEHATTLVAAARGALYASPAVATDYLQVALSLLREGGEHWHEAQVLLARARLLTGDASESRALLDSLRSAIPAGPPEEASALADSSRTERRLGRYAEAGALARSGLAALADHDSATAAALHSEMADYAYDVQDYETFRHHAETAAAIARGHRDSVGEAKALAQAALACLFTGHHSTAQAMMSKVAEFADAASDAALLTNLEALFQAGMTEGMMGRLADCERHLARAADLSRRTGQIYIQPQILTVLANAQARSGNLGRALASLDETAEHIERVGNRSTLAINTILRAEILFWRNGSGDAQQVVALAEQAAALTEGPPISWTVSVRCFLAELVLNQGDPVRAGRELLEAAGGVELPRLTAWRRPRCCDTLSHAAFAEGDRAAVDHWAELAEASVRELPSTGRLGFALRTRMRAHAIHGEIEPAVRSAREAVADFTASGERIEVCRTLLAIAESALDCGRTDEVTTWLRQVEALAKQCGSARLTGEVNRLRRRIAPTTETVDAPNALTALSRREQEIAGLASTGMTSNEIAEALFLSTRTVDTHLGRIYRKLNVSNRAGLTHAMLTSTAPGQPQTSAD